MKVKKETKAEKMNKVQKTTIATSGKGTLAATNVKRPKKRVRSSSYDTNGIYLNKFEIKIVINFLLETPKPLPAAICVAINKKSDCSKLEYVPSLDADTETSDLGECEMRNSCKSPWK